MDDELKKDFYQKLAPKSGHEKDKFDASFLQTDVRQVEHEQLSQVVYNKDKTRQAIVHSREDLVLIYSMIMSNNKLLHQINRQLVTIIILILGIAVLLYFLLT